MRLLAEASARPVSAAGGMIVRRKDPEPVIEKPLPAYSFISLSSPLDVPRGDCVGMIWEVGRPSAFDRQVAKTGPVQQAMRKLESWHLSASGMIASICREAFGAHPVGCL